MKNDLWVPRVPNAANWFNFSKESIKLSYKSGNHFFTYDDKKYYFRDVVWFKSIVNSFGMSGVIDNRNFFLHMLVDGEEIAINKSLNHDADYLDAYNLYSKLSAYRNNELMQKYQSNKPLEFYVTPHFSIVVENKKLYCLYEDKKYEVVKIATTTDKIVFKTQSKTFEAKHVEISDLSFLENYTEEFIELKMAYVKSQRKIEITKALICIPLLTNLYFEFYLFEGVLEFITIALAIWGVWLLVKYFLWFVYAPIVNKFNSYGYKFDLDMMRKKKG